jgi:hypothetical protein
VCAIFSHVGLISWMGVVNFLVILVDVLYFFLEDDFTSIFKLGDLKLMIFGASLQL